jgi:hypothetical protein
MLSIHLHVDINNEHMNLLIKLVGLPTSAEAWSDNLHTNPLKGVILLSKPT